MRFTLAKYRSVKLTDRDYELIRHIKADGAKSAAYLTDRFWGGKSAKAKAGFKRIRILMNAGLLERRPQLLYLTKKAEALFSNESGVGEEKSQ